MRLLKGLAVGTATALLLAACGGDGDELSEEEFLTQANEICRVGEGEIEESFNEFFPNGEPTQAEVEEFLADNATEYRDAIVSNLRSQIDGIRDLDGPSAIEDDLDPLLDEGSVVIDGIAAGSPEEFFLTENEGLVEVITQLGELGLTSCGEGE